MKRGLSFLTAKNSFGMQVLEAPVQASAAMLEHADAGLDTLHYLTDTLYVDTVVDLCVSSTGIVRGLPALRKQAGLLLRRLLAFPAELHRTAAYARLQQTLEHSPNQAVVAAAVEMLQTPLLLSQLVVGLDDPVPTVAATARFLCGRSPLHHGFCHASGLRYGRSSLHRGFRCQHSSWCRAWASDALVWLCCTDRAWRRRASVQPCVHYDGLAHGSVLPLQCLCRTAAQVAPDLH
jgi:hypothetical protein